MHVPFDTEESSKITFAWKQNQIIIITTLPPEFEKNTYKRIKDKECQTVVFIWQFYCI